MLCHIRKQFFSRAPLLPKLESFKDAHDLHLRKLTNSQAHELLARAHVTDWKFEEHNLKIKKDIKFDDFQQAFAFMNGVAVISEEIGHHPEWSNVYNKIHVHLNTHNCDGLSMKDILLAFIMNEIQLQVKTPSSPSDISFLNQDQILQKWNAL